MGWLCFYHTTDFLTLYGVMPALIPVVPGMRFFFLTNVRNYTGR